MSVFVLIHSPLVGPYTWALVADELRRKGYQAPVPSLYEVPESTMPYWQQHVAVVKQTLESVPGDQAVVLVSHSGSGMLLPAIGQGITHRVAAYLFVDAGLPQDGMSRLDRFETDEARAEFRRSAINGLLPTWTDTDLEPVIDNAAARRRFVEELRPMPLAIYEEPLPVFANWPDAPCGYLRLSQFYEPHAAQARQTGWAYREFNGGHFHMLVDPGAVAEALVSLAVQLRANL